MARPKGSKLPHRLSLGLSQEQYAELTKLAERNNASVAWMIRRAVQELIDKYGEDDEAVVPMRSNEEQVRRTV